MRRHLPALVRGAAATALDDESLSLRSESQLSGSDSTQLPPTAEGESHCVLPQRRRPSMGLLVTAVSTPTLLEERAEVKPLRQRVLAVLIAGTTEWIEVNYADIVPWLEGHPAPMRCL